MPENEGGLCEGFSFEDYLAVKNEAHWEASRSALAEGGCVTVYVTGLTAALTQFISEMPRSGTLLLWHWDTKGKVYRPQVVWGDIVISSSLSAQHFYPGGAKELWSMSRGGELLPYGEYCSHCGSDPGNGASGHSYCCGGAILYCTPYGSKEFAAQHGYAHIKI